MRSGQYNELITIEAPPATRDAAGQATGSWVVVGQEWAAMRQLNGMETIKAGAVTEVARASFRIRWRTSYTTAMRVVHGGLRWNIKAVTPDRVRREHVDLICEALRGS